MLKNWESLQSLENFKLKITFWRRFFAHPVYINDLPEALNETGSYLYVDYTCIFYQDKDVEKIEFSSLCEWFRQ